MIYTNRKNAWVDAALFANWLQKTFVPTVQAKLKVMDLEPKAVFLLNNCSAHPDKEELTSANGKIIAKLLLPTFTFLILLSIKHRSRKKILEELVFQDGVGSSIIDFVKGINMLTVTNMIAAS